MVDIKKGNLIYILRERKVNDMKKLKLDFANKFITGELYSLDGSMLKFIKYEIGWTMFGEAYKDNCWEKDNENKEKLYNAIGFDFKPLTVGANIVYKDMVDIFTRINKQYSHQPIEYWQKRFNDIIDTGLVSEDPLAPTQSQITENKEDPFELYGEAYGIRLWLLYNYGYFIFNK